MSKEIQLYNKICFNASVLLELLDEAKETSFYNGKLKNQLNGTIREIEKEVGKHNLIYQNAGMIDDNLSGVDVYNITANAYHEMHDFLVNTDPDKVVSTMAVIKSAEDKLNDVKINYEPAKI